MSLIDHRKTMLAAATHYAERTRMRRRRAQSKRALATNGDWKVVDTPARIFERARRLGIALPPEAPTERAGQRLLESILWRDERVSSSFLHRGARASRAVGRIVIRDGFGQNQGYATGFLVSDRLLLTNHHVLPGPEYGLSMLELDFIEDLERVAATAVFALEARALFITSVELDYTLVALAAAYDAGQAAARGWLPLIPASGKAVVGELVNLIQHPRGGPQQVALRANEVLDVFDHYLHYGADTEPGASGSPVCNDQWQLAALHRSGVPGLDAAGRIELTPEGQVARWVANEGVRVSSIVADLLERPLTPAAQQLIAGCFRSPLTSTSTATRPEPAWQGSGWVTLPLRVAVQLGASSTDTAVLSAALADTVSDTGADAGADAVRRSDALAAELPPGVVPLAPARLEAIVVRTRAALSALPLRELEAAGWRVRPIAAEPGGYDLLPPGAPTVRESWELVHRLRASDGIEEAEPSWIVESIAELPPEADSIARSAPGAVSSNPAAPKTWALDLIAVRDAWQVLPASGGRALGEGIRVAHPDSGYTRHSELVESSTTLDIASGYDFVDDDADPLDVAGFHGTATASVLVSTETGELMGAAPRAVLVPLRVANQGLLRPEPVLLSSGATRLRDAIDRAIERDCHVISISLGWLANASLHRAIRRAWDANLLIVAAAGNYTGPFVVWPGRYPEVICMSGCDAERRVWAGSAFGVGVDFSAPARDVWKADGNVSGVVQSSGTSFATALTAGVAALWLAHHGRGALLARYQSSGIKLAEVFHSVLRLSSDAKPKGFFSSGWGPIINAKQALLTPLPAPADIARAPGRELFAVTERASTMARAVDLIGREPAEGRALLARAYGLPESTLAAVPPGFGDELMFHALFSERTAPELQAARSTPAAPGIVRSSVSSALAGHLVPR